MCAIAGFVGRVQEGDLSQLGFALESMRHRGPDGMGSLSLVGGASHRLTRAGRQGRAPLAKLAKPGLGVLLGHCRLAIIDLSTDGLQPFGAADENFWLTYNGEIYNYVELREELISLGHSFKTKSDTEVVLMAYREWGIDAFKRFDGMFAIGLIDSRRRTVVLARDRFGEKPLYLRHTPNGLWFASEIKALLGGNIETANVRFEAAAEYLAFGRTHFGTETFYSGITQVEPGTLLEVSWESPSIIKSTRYFTLGGGCTTNFSGGEPGQCMFDALRQSIIRRLRSDVPVGTSLSGGLDSSAVASIAMKELGSNCSNFKAFTAVPDIPGYSELSWAQRVMEGRGAEHIVVPVTAADLGRDVDDLIRGQDEPVPTPSMYMQYCVMREARNRGVTVLLDGQGGDEILLGYERMYAAHLMQKFRSGKILSAYEEAKAFSNNSGLSLRRIVGLGLYSVGAARRFWRGLQHSKVLVPDIGKTSGGSTNVGGDLIDLQKSEILNNPLPALLRFEDRNAMRFGIETRLPFLDHELVEFCLHAPIENKLRDGWTKWMLRSAMNGKMPDSVAWRRDKKGYDAPIGPWLNQIGSKVKETLYGGDRSAALFRMSPEQAFAKTLGPNPRSAWRIFCLERWMRVSGLVLSHGE